MMKKEKDRWPDSEATQDENQGSPRYSPSNPENRH